MRALFAAVLGVFGFVAFASGCTTKDSPPSDGGVEAATRIGDAGAIRSDYPLKPETVPLAARVCDALQALPGRRMAECCGGAPTQLLAGECTRLLSTSLTDGVVRVDDAKVTACAKAMEASLVGCDWVTPSSPPLPEECKGLVNGQLAEHARCRSHLDCKAPLHCTEGTCTAPEKVGTICGRTVDALAVATRQTDVETIHPTCAALCSLITHKCEAMPEAGAKCFASGGCAPGQLCIDAKCTEATAGARGQACAGTNCADGLRCVAKVCVPKAASGETCVSDFDCARGGCASGDGGRACGMTCSHAGDLDAIRKVLAIPHTAPSSSAR